LQVNLQCANRTAANVNFTLTILIHQKYTIGSTQTEEEIEKKT